MRRPRWSGAASTNPSRSCAGSKARSSTATSPSATRRIRSVRSSCSAKQGREVKAFEGTLVAFERLRHFAFVIPSPAYSSEAHFRLTPQGPGRTHVDYAIDVTLHTLKAKVGAALLRVPLGFFVRKQMRRLRALAMTSKGTAA